MYFPMGRKSGRRTLGRVADFCPFCRGFRPFRLLRVDSFLHVYGAPIGGRIQLGFAKECEICGLLGGANPDAYRGVSADRSADVDALIAETNPEVRRAWSSRMLLEERVKARKLTPGERTQLIREPFDRADEILRRRDAEGKLDAPTNVGCLASVALPVASFYLLPLAWKASGESIEIAVVAIAGACVMFTFLAIVTDHRRFAKRSVLPRLVAALRLLEPTPEEVDAVFESLRHDRSPLAEVVTSREVFNGLMERWE